MKCYFCHRRGITGTREHLISAPVAAAGGLDLKADYLAQIDASSGNVQIPPAPLSAHAVKGPCARCNNGWMSELEQAFAEILTNVKNRTADVVSGEEFNTIGRWLLKTYIVAGLRDSNFQDPFSNDGLKGAIVHNPRQANDLAEERTDLALQESVLAFGQHASNRITAFGNPSGDTAGHTRFAGVFAVGFSALNLQLWIVNPTLPFVVKLPQEVARLKPGSSWATRPVGCTLDPQRVSISS